MNTYHVKVFSITNAVRVIDAMSPEEAFDTVDAEMKESIAHLIRQAEVRNDVLQITGRAGAEGKAIQV